MKPIDSFFGREIPDNGLVWWSYVKQGILPKPDVEPNYYREETIARLSKTAGIRAMSSQSEFGEWCRQELFKRNPPKSQGECFQNTLAALERAKRLDQETADDEFNKRVEAHVAKMLRDGRL